MFTKKNFIRKMTSFCLIVLIVVLSANRVSGENGATMTPKMAQSMLSDLSEIRLRQDYAVGNQYKQGSAMQLTPTAKSVLLSGWGQFENKYYGKGSGHYAHNPGLILLL